MCRPCVVQGFSESVHHDMYRVQRYPPKLGHTHLKGNREFTSTAPGLMYVWLVQVRSISLDKWTKGNTELLKQIGNSRSNSLWEEKLNLAISLSDDEGIY